MSMEEKKSDNISKEDSYYDEEENYFKIMSIENRNVTIITKNGRVFIQ